VLLITTLDDIAWLTNCRGTDIDYNPVFFSYALFYVQEGQERLDLFTNPQKVADIQDYLSTHKINVLPYEDINQVLEKLASENDKKVGVHTNTCNAALWNILKDKAGVELKDNIVQFTKAEKNETE